MQALNDFLALIDGFIGSSFWFPYVLIGTGLFFTIYLKFPQIRYFSFAIKVLKGKFQRSEDEGDTSHFQALTTALSGTVGTGNISGVALAVHMGGPAALFWMLVTAAVGMCEGDVEGVDVGSIVGSSVGNKVGEVVGACVTSAAAWQAKLLSVLTSQPSKQTQRYGSALVEV